MKYIIWKNFISLNIANYNIFEKIYYSYFLEQHLLLLLYVFISFILTLILFSLGFLLSENKSTFEKLSSYECGFEPFGDGHLIFNIQFFIVGILFIIFDLEIAYLFPWTIYLGNLSLFSFFLMFFFLILLVIGFIYEWKKGALDWV